MTPPPGMQGVTMALLEFITLRVGATNWNLSQDMKGVWHLNLGDLRYTGDTEAEVLERGLLDLLFRPPLLSPEEAASMAPQEPWSTDQLDSLVVGGVTEFGSEVEEVSAERADKVREAFGSVYESGDGPFTPSELKDLMQDRIGLEITWQELTEAVRSYRSSKEGTYTTH